MSGWEASVGVYICQVGRVELGGERERERERGRETGDGRREGEREGGALLGQAEEEEEEGFPVRG